uniref:ATP synthase F0 subunit 8 n=1 Tax=Ixodes nuttallianus TaxID=213687 RepID=A0A976MY61_9ACAR|nr:ATP synthase F0 subunit 8 [Ixodes nuttallianus]UNO53783.1 ATP synthase F0 subunit 8 [Ixodes nuttallianus]
MPQLFPMNWILLSILFSFILVLSLINLYFFMMKSKKLVSPHKLADMYLFKW